ncbi:hypothetical protein HF324_16790 [Chitinophaga oryzae]|uniref:Uncharacterized protein n=1 Tax=Chitinophaga oryzae TaxID=2725414 RepID=A0AAE6ZKB2_9BACT|nr:hypothetical protein [Chitinophaga oryzae]QJB32959.1 hypothetical protein HF329_17205 [Chitinophaga oryzae]QJB39423.1 hypothetical protein HF324_16790 [Chitinophaga oryzae]
MTERPQYRHFSTWAEHFQQMDEMFEKERRRIAAFTREEADQFLRDVGVYHLLVGPKRRNPWRKKSARRKQKEAAQLKRLKRRK